MTELTPENLADYLRGRGWVGPGPVRVEVLGGGVSNAVYRVEAGETLFVLKQARTQLRTRDPWFSDLDRVFREMQVMETLVNLLPPGTVPAVLHRDEAEYLFTMSHAPRGARVWKGELLAGGVDLATGEHAGRVLGRTHEATHRATHGASSGGGPGLERFADRRVFVQLRVDPYYRRVLERFPEVGGAVEALIARMSDSREALCHGDFSPKNILTHAGGFTLVDYETAHLGDPTMDLGFFLSHLLLKACRRPRERGRYFDLTRAFWRGYAGEARFRPLPELAGWGVGHLGVCLLARIDGTSPVDYLPEEPRREAVRRLGRSLLRERPGDWDDVLARAEREFAPLE